MTFRRALLDDSRFSSLSWEKSIRYERKVTALKQRQIGVLALQGDYPRHRYQLELVGCKVREVRLPEDLNDIEALIFPGGESTTMNILIDRFRMREPLLTFCRKKPVWGTCAGMIMLSKHIEGNFAGVEPFGVLDIDVLRNGYGRQVFSFEEEISAALGEHTVSLHATFIRAPRVIRTGAAVKILAEFQGSPVLVCERNIMASSFHTELDDDTTLLRYFLETFVEKGRG